MSLSFENLPKAVEELQQSVNDIQRILLTMSKEKQNEPDQWFNVKELCAYLPDKPKRSTVYSWVYFDAIPNHKPKGTKKLKFLKSEIDVWMKEGRRKTIAETEKEAEEYLKNLQKGGDKW